MSERKSIKSCSAKGGFNTSSVSQTTEPEISTRGSGSSASDSHSTLIGDDKHKLLTSAEARASLTHGPGTVRRMCFGEQSKRISMDHKTSPRPVHQDQISSVGVSPVEFKKLADNVVQLSAKVDSLQQQLMTIQTWVLELKQVLPKVQTYRPATRLEEFDRFHTSDEL